jgi:hypothetical protein
MFYPAHHDLPPIIKNYFWNFAFNITINDEVMDLDGYTVKMKVLNSFEDPEEMAMLLISSEDNIDIDEDSWVTCYFSAEQTATLPLGLAKYVIELIQPDGGDPLPLMQGRIQTIPCDGAVGVGP